MPSKNLQKIYVPNSFYHVYNRGVNKQTIFRHADDYRVFLQLLKRHLSKETSFDKSGREYKNYYDEIDLVAFCLMSNHFHLLIFQSDPDAMTKLLRSIGTAYTMYFNTKYKRVGHLFQNRFKASLISQDAYMEHISRYIHLNPKNYKSWEYSSLQYYLGNKNASWVKPTYIMENFTIPQSYLKFLADYEDHKKMLDSIKQGLANS